MENLNEVIYKLKNSFKDVKIKELILDEKWYNKNIKNGIDSTGFCFYSHEVIYRLFGGKENWLFMRISDDIFPEFGPYYFLKNKKTNEILDITSDQCTKLNIIIPYEKGKGRGLQKTSKKCKMLMDYINKKTT